MEYTSGLKLRKPQKGANADAVDIDDFNFNFDKLDVAINGITIVTIPADNQDTENPNYTEINDGEGGNTYYSIIIPVQGMTSSYVGTNAADYVRPDPFSIEENEELRDLFGLILDMKSGNGTITILMSEKPSQSFQIYLYGIGTIIESNANTNNSEIIEEPEERPEINPISQEIDGPGATNPNP